MERAELVRTLTETCLIRGSGAAIFPKSPSSVPKRSENDWLLDFRRAFLDTRISRRLAAEFWNAYESRFPFQIAVVEMATVPFIGSLLAEWSARWLDVNGIVIRKSRKKDGLCNIVEGTVRRDVPTVIVDDIVNSGTSLLKALTVAKGEGIPIAEAFCLCHFENPSFAKKLADSPFFELPIRSVFRLSDFGLERRNSKPESATYSAAAELLFDLGEPHLGLVVPKSSPLLDGDSLYVAGESGKVVKLDLRTDGAVWTYSMEKTPAGKNILSSVVDCGDEICFGAYDGAVHFVNKDSGKKRLAVSLADWIGSTPCADLDRDRAFVGLEHFGTVAGGICAFRISDGETLWEVPDTGFVHASPVFDPERNAVYCGSNSGTFRRLDADTGEEIWKREFPGEIKVRPTLSPDGTEVFFGCFDGRLRCLDADTGKTLWEYETPFNVYSEALGGTDGIFVWCLDKNFYHFSWNGEKLAEIPTGGRIFATPSRFGDDLVVFGSNDMKIRFYDVTKRKEAFAIQHSERIVTAVTLAGRSAYFSDFANRVWKLDLNKLTPRE